MILRALAILLLYIHSASAQEAVFDIHVHLHDGEASLRAYEADVAASKIGLGKTVAALKRLDLTAEETGNILSGNARKLFGRE